MCPCSFNFFFNSKLSSEKINEQFNFFLGCVEALYQISASHVEWKWKKAVSSKDSLFIFC